MRGAAHLSESRKLSDGLKFMRSNVGRGFPPNTFIVVDTHSDEFTGMLQHTGGHTGGTNTTITEIIEAYLGTEFLKCMGEASDAVYHSKVDEAVVRPHFQGKRGMEGAITGQLRACDEGLPPF